jgi:hypothetical protein
MSDRKTLYRSVWSKKTGQDFSPPVLNNSTFYFYRVPPKLKASNRSSIAGLLVGT